ncbi:MAG: hypothetical protein LBQ57_09925 [Spirochaetales bacterium]|nr:hypothetical protein [Spirochaetales bacterium]
MEYYDRLTEVRRKGNYEQWIRFFVQAIHDTARDAIETIDKLVSLREDSAARVASLGRSAKAARRVYEYIERAPIIEIGKTAAGLGMSFNTAAKAVENLCSLGILRRSRGAKRNRCFVYEKYLDILRNGT